MMRNLLVRASELTHRTFVLPLLAFYPTSRCNSRCISCDWWKSSGEDDLTIEEIDPVARVLPELGTRLVVFSGGEPLLRSDLFEIANLFLREEVRLELLTSGVLLERRAPEVSRCFRRVILSLDATTPELYRAVRGVDALSAVEAGVSRLQRLAPELPVSARATLHKANFHQLPALIEKARDMRLHGISFLAADVSSGAFGRRGPVPLPMLKLDREEVRELRSTIAKLSLEDGFVAESREKLLRIADYYDALNGDRAFPPVSCNAPWVSAVVEANGAVRPCFFHEPIGNIRRTPLLRILRRELPAFRRELDMQADPVCTRCVCTIRLGRGRMP